MKKKSLWLGILFLLLVIGAVVYSTMGVQAYRVEVCVDFEGRTACRTAAASTEEQALRAAKENACALVASGVTDTIQCGSHTPPASVRWLARP